ncbi:fimbrial chaperone [Klebsiella pneumoniae]|nr:fimbrial chaperone [Klebsiella pneumoniae]
MTLSCSSTDFENDSDFRPSRARCCLRFRLCRSIRCVYRLLITCSFPFRRDSYNTITFNGIVSDTTCTATIDGGVTAIDMGTTSVADLKAYTFGAAKNFSFSLADCPTAEEGGNSIARVTFGGVSDTANSDYFKNQATDEPATGVAVALFDEAGNVMKNNEEGSDVDISSGAATIPFTVKMVKSGDADPTKGTVQTTVTYNVTYH